MIDHKIYPLGESALTIDFGNEISVEKNNRVIGLADRLNKKRFKGFSESVPAYSSLTVFYDMHIVRKCYPVFGTAFEFVKSFVETQMAEVEVTAKTDSTIIEIPASFDKDSALDLDFVAKTNGLDPDEVIEIFLSKLYQVFMLGFLPGFAYMGELDERIATPRKETPRTKVPKGSIGIAGSQTGIYPLESPGGWQIIGKTEEDLFTPERDNVTLLNVGDIIKFVKD